MVFYTRHNGVQDTIYYRISTNVEDISSWGAEQTITGDAKYDYTNPIQLSGESNKIYLIYRKWVTATEFYWGYVTSTDGGVSWSSPKTLLSHTNYLYAKVDSNGVDKIYFTASGHPQHETSSTYFFYYYNGGFYKADGTLIKTEANLPMVLSDLDLVYNGTAQGNYSSWVWDIAVNNGIPYIAFATFPSTTDHRYNYARWTGSAWDIHEITTAGGQMSGGGAAEWGYSGGIDLDHGDPTTLYLSKDISGQFEIQKATTSDGGSTWSFENVTSSSTEKNIRPVVIRNHTSDFPVVWMKGSYPSYTTYNTTITSTLPSTISGYSFATSGLEVYSSAGGTTARNNLRAEINTSGTNYVQYLFYTNSLLSSERYQKIRFNTYAVGNAYRFIPLAFSWSKTGGSTGLTHNALTVLWYSSGLYLFWNSSDGGTLSSLQLTATTPTADTWYIAQLYTSGTTTHVKVTKESDGSIIYDNDVTTANYSSSTLYAMTGQYGGTSAGTITGYYDDWIIRQYNSPEPSTSVASETTLYSTTNPAVNPISSKAQAFTSLSGFSETATKNGGQIKYQISNDSGTTWYWYNSGWTTTVSGYTEANTAADINTNISTFPVGSKSFLFKAYLNSDGSQLVQLDSVDLTYVNDTTSPTISAVSSTPTSTGATITWTTNENASSKVDYGLTTSYGSTTTETDTPTGVTSHSVALSSLSTCTTYHYRVRSIDTALNETIDSDNTFITTGCTSSSTSTSNNSSSTSTSVCSDQSPGTKAPWLYGAIAQDSGSVLLYFTEADNPVNKYVLEYGTQSGNYPYGVQDMGVNSRGQMTFLVKSLSSNTTYYFKVRGGNGCATGTWSNEISVTTKGLVSFNQLDITQSQLEPQPVTEVPSDTSCQSYTVKSGDTLWSIAKNLLGDGNKYKEIVEQNKDKYSSLETSNNLRTGWELKISCGEQTTTEETKKTTETPTQGGYDVKVKVVDTAKKPVEGATVTLHSIPQTTKTDKNGVASFTNVEAGDHKVLIAYNNFEGEQSINLTGNVKEFDLNVTVQQKAISLSPLAYGIIGVMGLVIISLIVLLIKNKRKG